MPARARVLIAVALCAVAAAGAAAAIAFVARGPDEAAIGPIEGTPPLALDAALEEPAVAEALLAAERLYNAGRLDEARQAFDALLLRRPELVEAQVGDAMARWPAGTIPRLRDLVVVAPERAVVRLHLGLALFWDRQEVAAADAWRAAEEVEPDSPAALRAENLLHPDMPLFRPIFVPDLDLPADLRDRPLVEQLAGLELRAEREDTADAWLAYGTALQRASRAVSAEEAFGRAVAAEPDRVDAQVALIVTQFDKDDPSVAFSQLGPLAQQHPRDPVVRYHLGLMLLWLREVGQARLELAKAVDAGPGTFYADQAELLLRRLDEVAAEPSEGPAETTR